MREHFDLLSAHSVGMIGGMTTLEITPGSAETWVGVIRGRLAIGERAKVTFERPSVSPAQMAEQIGVSRATIQRRIAAGEIRAEQRGNRHRIPLDEVERFRHAYVREMADVFVADF
jgi:excisionase family DNA binding protein